MSEKKMEKRKKFSFKIYNQTFLRYIIYSVIHKDMLQSSTVCMKIKLSIKVMLQAVLNLATCSNKLIIFNETRVFQILTWLYGVNEDVLQKHAIKIKVEFGTNERTRF